MRRMILASAAALGVGSGSVNACTGPGMTVVEEIYPSRDVLPENMLRMYLYFSAPMADADIIPSITLHMADGTPVDEVFLSNRFDLWSPDRTRLTLLFDPGRVKTGLEAHAALGRALSAGESYVLTVGAGATDANGCSLAAEFTHRFRAGPSDVEVPDPTNWGLQIPTVGSLEPLRIALGSPHDHLSMAFRVRVLLGGETIAGAVSLEENESVWVFTPREAWQAATYDIEVGEEFEDLSGNRPGELFDQPVERERPVPELRLQFLPGAD